jgi:hypothetical protein
MRTAGPVVAEPTNEGAVGSRTRAAEWARVTEHEHVAFELDPPRRRQSQRPCLAGKCRRVPTDGDIAQLRAPTRHSFFAPRGAASTTPPRPARTNAHRSLATASCRTRRWRRATSAAPSACMSWRESSKQLIHQSVAEFITNNPESARRCKVLLHVCRSNWLFLSLIPSGIGFVLMVYGKKQIRWPYMVAGLLFMVYPYFATTVASLVLIGAGSRDALVRCHAARL